MIYGIGCDICDINRIEDAPEGFSERFFTKDEQELFQSKKKPYQTVAANFAVKEAFSKALGTGVSGFGLRDVEVLRDEKGKPYINLFGNAETVCKNLGIENIHVSISHTDKLCMAYVILEK
ncbi:MAG: holo-[acyl-carrier-protein] synthase [Ruminococcaceae bacterium]|nr:holo-[acyl-carrier-protein] synthase [Oscillospiraceae bacterium]